MICPSCGTTVDAGATICPKCNASLTAGTAGTANIASAMPYVAELPRTSGLAIAGFVTSFFCGVVGLVLSIIGLNQAKRSNGRIRGSGLAIAGIVISAVNLVFGMLAAVAIPAFMDYMHKAKSSEADLRLNMIGRHAKRVSVEDGKLPIGRAPLTPAAACCGQRNNKCQPNPADWATPEWQKLEFEISEPGFYQYSWTGDGNTFDADAVGDLDCDTQMATYHLHIEMIDGNPVQTITKPPHGVY